MHLRAAVLVTLLLLASPLASPALGATAFSASFTPNGSNEWWIQTKVSANEPISSVSAQVDGSAWQPLKPRSYGWAASIHAPSGSIVKLRAVSSDGDTAHSGCYKWTSRTPVACPGAATATTTAPSTSTAPTSTATTFTPVSGSEWWVQVKVSGSPTKVEARDTDGAWTPLTLRSYGWAASFHVERGHDVQYRAIFSSGATSTSCWFVHPGTTCDTSSTTAASEPTSPPAPATSEPTTTTFAPATGNEWWVQVKVSGSPTKVEARDCDATAVTSGSSDAACGTGGSWVPLAKRSYGWAGSMHVERGHEVQYRATLSGGATSTSCWFVHPGTTCETPEPRPEAEPAPAAEPTPEPASSSVIWRDSFTESPWAAPWKMASSWDISNTDVVRESGSAVPTFLRVTYPAGEVGEGAGWKAEPFEPRDSLHLRYKVRFPTDFDFVRGGKLPGLYGGTGPSGGNIPDGTDGWSARLMWRAGGAGEVYPYLPTSETWGSRIGTGNWNFTADGKWHTIEQAVVLNTPGTRNGEITIWYDGAKVVHATGLTFRTVSTLKTDGIFFSTFFGGNDQTWATPETVHADFADFAVATAYIGG